MRPVPFLSGVLMVGLAVGSAWAAQIRHVGDTDPTTEDGYISQPGNQFWGFVDESGGTSTKGPAGDSEPAC